GRSNQILRNLARNAPDKVQAACRKAGILEQMPEGQNGRRSVFGSLEYYRAAGAERRTDLADGLVERKIPRSECGADTDRLLHHHSNARCALVKARSRSAVVACGNRPRISSVAGLRTSCSGRPSPLAQVPSI